jgi:rhomboid protease GluP
MKETFIKYIIKGFNKFYGYGVIELNDNRLRTSWALVKATAYNRKRVIVFVSDLNESDYMSMINSLKSILNSENIELIRIYIKDIKSEPLNILDYEGKVELILDIFNKKIEGSALNSSEVVQELLNITNNFQGEEESKSRAKYNITLGIIGVNVLVYLITAVLSQNIFYSNQDVLIELGAKYNELISKGEYYRLITSMFLHGGLLHLAVNMYSLYSIGPLIERIYGKVKYLSVYFISGIIASVFSYIFSDSVSIGASGAIFGLLGTTLVFAIKMRNNLGKGFLKNVASVIVINLFIGFSLPNIDNYAHLGGLIGGIIMALLFYGVRKD